MKRPVALGLASAALVALVVGGLAWWLLARPAGPEETAHAYLEALAAGDGQQALALAEEPSGPDVDRAAALEGAEEFISEASVVGIESDDGAAPRATVSFTLDGEDRSATFALVEQDGRWLVAADAFGAVEATTTIGDAVLAGGEALPTAEAVSLLPARYAVAAAPAGLVTGSAAAVVLPGATIPVGVEAAVSPEAGALAQEQLDAYAENCTAPATDVPEACGLRVPWGADLAALSSISFRVEQLPQVALADDLRSFAATGGVLVATVSGTTREGAPASFTYRADDWALRGGIVLTAEGMELEVE